LQSKLKSGKFFDANEVITEGLRLLWERDRIQKARLAELKEKIRIGIKELDCGEGIDGEEVFAELEEDIRLMEAIA
jgi:antitoxin ParD1/3/4